MYKAITAKWFLFIADSFMVLLSFFLLLQTIFVHLQTLYFDEYCIKTVSPLGIIELKWQDISDALLRERVNAISRTDHLLILKTYDGQMLTFNTSTLSPEDENFVLGKIARMVNLKVHRDAPSI